MSGSGEPLLPPFAPIFSILAVVSLIILAGRSLLDRSSPASPFPTAAVRWGLSGWLWWLAGGSWEVVRLLVGLIGPGVAIVRALQRQLLDRDGRCRLACHVFDTVIFVPRYRPRRRSTWHVGAWRSAAQIVSERAARCRDDYRIPLAVWLCFGAYLIVFVAYELAALPRAAVAARRFGHVRGALVELAARQGIPQLSRSGNFSGRARAGDPPAVDSALLLWPSQMLLELCDSALLAASCIPVYWMARRHTGQSRPAVWLAAACLLYFPLQYLDIAIDLKTFRPNGLAIPILLFALDQLERRRFKTFCLLVAVALTAQEDYAIVLAPLGVWIALSATRRTAGSPSELGPAPAPTGPLSPAGRILGGQHQSKPTGRCLALGAGLAVFSVALFGRGDTCRDGLLSARAGNPLRELFLEVRQDAARDRANDGHAPGSIVGSVRQCALGRVRIDAAGSVGFLPLFSPGRLAVALPLFLTLCLNEVIDSPLHHVHAAAVPILLWAAAAGLGTASRGPFGLRRFAGPDAVGRRLG